MYGNSGASSTEAVATLTIGSGTGSIVLNPASGQSLSLKVTTLSAVVAGGTAILRNVGTGGSLQVTTATAFGTQGGGADGSITMTVRPDLIGDNIATGYDSSLAFVTTKDSTTTGLASSGHSGNGDHPQWHRRRSTTNYTLSGE